MKPTDRQIAAVEDVLRGLVVITGDSTWDMNYVARRVLAAAAEVGADRAQEYPNKATRRAVGWDKTTAAAEPLAARPIKGNPGQDQREDD